MKKVAIISLGCAKNLVDSENILGLLIKNHYQIVSSKDEADILIINTMITIVTTALIIFTSLSLVVSSFMIAVITYISVMERVKEIGVIRSLGGRKKDVSRLFIAENLVTGAFSGVIGLVITGVVCLIINAVISPFGIPAIAVLTLPIMGIMLALSIVLSVVAGFIPSMHASRQDPVIALRSE